METAVRLDDIAEAVTTSEGRRGAADGRRAWRVVLLLFVMQMINFFDKNVIGLAAVPIMAELRLSPGEYGLVASAFYALYAASGVFVGFFVTHRVGPKLLLAVAVAIWSLTQLPIILSASLPVLIAARVILGIGEGPATTTAVVACHRWFDTTRRNMPTALVMSGASVGSFVSAPLLSYAMIAYGWRAAFAVCGLLGAVWLVFWLLFGADGPAPAAHRDPVAAPEVLLQRALWRDPTIVASIVVGFCAYWMTGFSVAWLAPFVRTGLGFDAAATGWIVAVVTGSGTLTMIGVSFVSQRMLTAGKGPRAARAQVNAFCLLGSALAFCASAIVDDPMLRIVALAIGASLPLLTFTLGPAIVADVVPPAQRARVVTMIYSGITIAGLISPALSGWMIGAAPGLAGYDRVLLLNAAIMLAAAVVAFHYLRPDLGGGVAPETSRPA